VQDAERRDLVEILEDRYGVRSTIITSQLPPAQWHDYLSDATLADAICDRLLHNAHRIVLIKRTLAEKGDQARQLTGGLASLRSDHDRAISLITIDRPE
jgi:DNA replication protein DnaC